MINVNIKGNLFTALHYLQKPHSVHKKEKQIKQKDIHKIHKTHTDTDKTNLQIN